MDPTRLMNIPCIVTPRAAAADLDEYGNEVLEAGTPVDTVCWHHQTGADERTVDANTQTATWTVYLPPGIVVSGLDVVTIAGGDYEVLGPPTIWVHPRTGEAKAVELTARKVA
jgi:phage tail protein X